MDETDLTNDREAILAHAQTVYREYRGRRDIVAYEAHLMAAHVVRLIAALRLAEATRDRMLAAASALHQRHRLTCDGGGEPEVCRCLLHHRPACPWCVLRQATQAHPQDDHHAA